MNIKLSKLLMTVIFVSLSLACSKDDSCGYLEPEGNEFTFNCNRYATDKGRLYIRHANTGDETTTCHVSLLNEPHNFGEFLVLGESNINYAEFSLTVTGESYVLQEIPSGIYTNNDLGSDSQLFDIGATNPVYYDAHVETNGSGSIFLNNNNRVGEHWDDITVEVSKIGSVYTIEYKMSWGDKKVKGKFVGEMEVVQI